VKCHNYILEKSEVQTSPEGGRWWQWFISMVKWPKITRVTGVVLVQYVFICFHLTKLH